MYLLTYIEVTYWECIVFSLLPLSWQQGDVVVVPQVVNVIMFIIIRIFVQDML